MQVKDIIDTVNRQYRIAQARNDAWTSSKYVLMSYEDRDELLQAGLTTFVHVDYGDGPRIMGMPIIPCNRIKEPLVVVSVQQATVCAVCH